MELKTESMKNMKKVVEHCLEELMKKQDLTPAETKAAIDGFHLYDELCCRIEDCETEEKDARNMMDSGYSGYGEPYREYHITSYGMPERAIYSNRSYGNMNRGYYMDGGMNYSGAPHYGVRGWYQNNGYSGLPGYPTEHINAGYSRHSIGDRIVSLMEKEMDKAESEYEREEIRKFIRMVRMAADEG